MLKNNRALVIISTVIILLPVLAGLILWNSLPAEMPVHWNARGEIDGWASRAFCVFGMPLIIAALFWVCIVATSLDKRNKDQNPKAASVVLVIIPALSLIVSSMTYTAALGKNPRVETIIPLFLGITFMIIGNYLPKFRRNSTMGLRIKWTLSSDENWLHTHRFAGRMSMIGGAVMAVTSFTGFAIPAIAAIFLIILAPLTYSYVHYVRHEK